MLLKIFRGISRVSVIRSIYMRMLYNIKYESIDSKISDSQMGGRKKKSCRNNLFIINGILYDIKKNKNSKSALIQIVDYEEMFDGIDLQQALIDLFNIDVRDETLSILFQANEEIAMSVNTPNGLTDRQLIYLSVLQGDTWASLIAGVQADSVNKDIKEAGCSYIYRGEVEVPSLGLVDDTLCVTEPGHKAHIVNSVMNVRAGDKTLRFGQNKCKKMFIGKKGESDLTGSLFVDTWQTTYVKSDRETDSEGGGEIQLTEEFRRNTEMEEVSEYKYLGFVLSNSADNMANIRSLRKKSIITTKSLLSRLKSLNLQKYYFECGILFMNTMLRTSILYASETYYNLKENELRCIERIEESFLRQLVSTRRFCKIALLYLEFGVWPARFEIKKLRLLFLKYILNQNKDSTIYNFLQTQLKSKLKGDFGSMCQRDLCDLEIEMTFNDIKNIKISKFKSLLKEKIANSAFKYLKSNIRNKGKDIVYEQFQMAEYLLPNRYLNIDDQKFIFSLRSQIFTLSDDENNQIIEKCICYEPLDIMHLYACKRLNEDPISIEYHKIYGNNTKEMKIIIYRIRQSLEKLQTCIKIKQDQKS